MSNILVFAQISDEAVHDVSLQCLVKARAIAGGQVTCLAVGPGAAAAAAGLFGYGADAVYAVEAPELGAYLTTPYQQTVQAFLEAHPQDVVLLPATTTGDDLAPVLAAKLGAACVVDADDLTTRDGNVSARRLEFDRKVFATYGAAEGATLVVTLKDGAAEVGEADPAATGQVEAFTPTLTDSGSAVRQRDVAAKSVNLKDAKIIVAVGAGVGTRENFEQVQPLAEVLGAEIGATRAVVDAGWLPADHQIGQTGATVRPDVYIACGISGAVQHRVGMMDARNIVAINTDKNAPIFKMAHYKVVGDLNAVVPKLVKLLNA